jgi:nucleoside-diphosphate-sugar epimerase
MNTVLVTGGGGFLGSYVIKDLLASGYKVVSFSRKPYPRLEKLGVRCVLGTISNPQDIERALKGVDAVIHTAALAAIWGKYEDFYETNVVGTKNLISVMKRMGIQYLVYTSSPSIVFDGESIEGDDESMPLATQNLAHYPATKKLAEIEVKNQVDGKFFAVCLRPHLIWGPNDPHFFPRLREKAKMNRIKQVGDGQNLVDTIYVENAAIAHRQALEALMKNHSLSGNSYFLGQEKEILCWQFIKDLVAASGERPKFSKVPLWLAYSLGAVLELFYGLFKIYDREPAMTKFMALQLAKSHYFSHKKAFEDFGYVPKVSYEDGMLALKAWAQSSK